jgi:hypothetical protein
MDAVAGAVHPIDVAAPIPAQVEDNLDRLVVALTERIRTALTLGQTLGVVREGDTQMMARLLMGMIREPVFQAWLYGEDLDTQGLVNELARAVKGGMLR